MGRMGWRFSSPGSNLKRCINPLRICYFGAHRPAITFVQVPALVHPDLLVEVTCTAYLGP